MASSPPTFEYTVLVDGTSTIRIVTDEAGMRVGDCVSVERGLFNNLRLVPGGRCDTRARPTPAALQEASACDQAKEALLRAETDAEFDRAERRVRLLCVDWSAGGASRSASAVAVVRTAGVAAAPPPPRPWRPGASAAS